VTFPLQNLFTLIMITRVAVSAALAGSIWATVRGKSCQTCKMASGLSGGLPLARIGTAFYLLVLLATFLPRSAPAAWSLAAAAAAHVVLVTLLLKHRIICKNCLLIAAAAIVAAITTIALAPSSNLPAILAAPAGGVLILFAIGIAAASAARRSVQEAERLLAEIGKDLPPVASGTIKMVVLAKPQCWACEFLKETVLPELEREFAGIMEVEFRPAPPGTPAPTLLIYGKNPMPFIGAAPADQIAPMIRMVLGQKPEQRHDRSDQIAVSATARPIPA